MWPKFYSDYKKDEPLKKTFRLPGKGIVGCEMNECNGWGTSYHKYKKKKRGGLMYFLSLIFGKEGKQ